LSVRKNYVASKVYITISFIKVPGEKNKL